jgi:hypothetical protein
LDDFIVYGPDEEQERRKARKERRHAGTMGISQSQLDEAASIFGGDMSEFLQNQLDEEDYDVRAAAASLPSASDRSSHSHNPPPSVVSCRVVRCI